MDPELAVLKRNTAHLERILGIQLYFEEPCLQTRAYRRKKYVLR
jgi:hypothetical protein